MKNAFSVILVLCFGVATIVTVWCVTRSEDFAWEPLQLVDPSQLGESSYSGGIGADTPPLESGQPLEVYARRLQDLGFILGRDGNMEIKAGQISLNMWNAPRMKDLAVLNHMPISSISHFYYQGDSLASLTNSPLQYLEIWCDASDLSPLTNLTNLKQLLFHGTKVKDLSPLAEIVSLEYLHIEGTNITELSPLSSLTALRGLYLDSVSASDLSPLSELRLESFAIEMCDNITDLSAVKGMPLRRFEALFSDGPLDISSLAGLKLEDVDIYSRVEKGMDVLRAMPSIKTINGERPAQFWKKFDAGVFSAKNKYKQILHAAGFRPSNLDVDKDGMIDLNLYDSGLSNVTALVDLNLPLKKLQLWNNYELKSIIGINRMKLDSLELAQTAVTDLRPLIGMQLKHLGIAGTAITDLGPISDMPLESFGFDGTFVTDLSPLDGMRLTELWGPVWQATNGLEAIRKMETLKEISGSPTNEFWAKYGSGGFDGF